MTQTLTYSALQQAPMTLARSVRFVDRALGIVAALVIGVALLAMATVAALTFPPSSGGEWFVTVCVVAGFIGFARAAGGD